MSRRDSDSDFDPHSIDAMLATIIANQEADRRVAVATLEQVTRTNGRVTKLETWRSIVTAKVVTLSAVSGGIVSFAAWLIGLYLKTH